MKRTFLTLVGVAAAVVLLANGRYEAAMSKNIPAMFSSSTPEALQGVVHQLSRIGEAEGDKWEPYYYAGFGYLRLSGMHEAAAEKDKYLGLAMDEIGKGLAIDGKNTELVTLQGYTIMMQLTVDPANRGMTHSGLAFETFNKAIQLDPKNPRAYFLLGRMQYGTAQFMGGGNAEACNSLARARALFEDSEGSANPFAPTWGMEDTLSAIKEICETGGE